jgi:hypothetical protein
MAADQVGFKAALDADMLRKGINERLLGQTLNVSQQSISKWRHRGFPPLYRVRQLVEYFGPNSDIAKLDFVNLMVDTPRVRVQPPVNVLPSMTDRQFGLGAAGAVAGDVQGSENLAIFLRSAPQRERYYAEQMMDFRSALPAELREYVQRNGSRMEVGQAQLKLDYLSGRVAAIINAQWPADATTGKSQYLLELAAVKTQHAGLHVVLFICCPDEAKAIGATRRLLAEVLGVEVVTVPRGAEIVGHLRRLEASPLGEDVTDVDFAD